MSRRDEIVVLGGYGAVGRRVVADLTAHGRRVIVAGRRHAQTARVAERHPLARPLPLDTNDFDTFLDAAGQFAAVVNCTGREDVGLARAAVFAGAHFVDISATRPYLQHLASLDDDAKNAGVVLLLSVGLAPGLTNVLAAELDSRHPGTSPLDIGVLLGLGEDHGSASRRWIYELLGTRFPDTLDPGGAVVRNVSQPKLMRFPDGLGRRRVYRFDLATSTSCPRTCNDRS